MAVLSFDNPNWQVVLKQHFSKVSGCGEGCLKLAHRSVIKQAQRSQRSYMNCDELNRDGPQRFSHLLKIQQQEVLGVL